MSQNSVKLFKSLINECSKIPDFNFRNYFIRRITDTFYNGQEMKGEQEIEQSLTKSKISVAMLQRQATLGSLYDEKRSIPLDK